MYPDLFYPWLDQSYLLWYSNLARLVSTLSSVLVGCSPTLTCLLHSCHRCSAGAMLVRCETSSTEYRISTRLQSNPVLCSPLVWPFEPGLHPFRAQDDAVGCWELHVCSWLILLQSENEISSLVPSQQAYSMHCTSCSHQRLQSVAVHARSPQTGVARCRGLATGNFWSQAARRGRRRA